MASDDLRRVQECSLPVPCGSPRSTSACSPCGRRCRRLARRTTGSPQARSENLNFTLGAAEVVAAAAVVAAGLLAGGAIAQEITRHDYDVTALVISGSDPELAGAALAALFIAAGYDGAWHRDWTDTRTAAQGRRTTDELASVFYRDQHRHDQELPQEP